MHDLAPFFLVLRQLVLQRTAPMFAACLAAGCVFPADDPTGLELSWRFAEVNEVDGEGSGRLRSCAGALVDRLVVSVTDNGDVSRRGTFDYPCEDGFQTPAEFSAEASDAFVDLRPGKYAVVIDSIGVLEAREVRAFDIEVLSRSPTAQGLDLAFEQVNWSLTISGADACTEAAFALHYLDPEVDLAVPERDDDDNVVDVVYRTALRSDRGLSLGGTPGGCADLAGDHTVSGVDQGRYRLQVTLDGRACADPLEIPVSSEGANSVIDLANLDCAG